MRQRLLTKKFLVAIGLATVILSLSGCVYLRLLYFKNQLKSFDQNVSVHAATTLTFEFRKPIVRDSDFVFISGSSPAKKQILSSVPKEEIWTWRFEKKPGDPTTKPFSMNFRTRFKEGLLTHMEIDETFVQLIGKDFIVSLFQSLGNAKINKIRRSMSIELDKNSIQEMQLPSLSEILAVMGEPTNISKQRSDPAAKCEYEFNFLNPKNGKKAAQFRLFFTGDLLKLEKTITGIRISGKAR